MVEMGLNAYLTLAALLFGIGAIGFLSVITLCAWQGGPIAVAFGVVGFRLVYVPITLTVAAGGGWATMRSAIASALAPGIVATAAILPAWWVGLKVGAPGDRVSLGLQILVTLAMGAALYWLLARLLLRHTYTRFGARVRTMLPDQVSSRVPAWAL